MRTRNIRDCQVGMLHEFPETFVDPRRASKKTRRTRKIGIAAARKAMILKIIVALTAV